MIYLISGGFWTSPYEVESIGKYIAISYYGGYALLAGAVAALAWFVVLPRLG